MHNTIPIPTIETQAQLKMAVKRFSMAANKKSAALSKQQTREIAMMLQEAPPKEEKARIKAEVCENVC